MGTAGNPAETSVPDLFHDLGSDPAVGLTALESRRRIVEFGPNEPAPIPEPSWLRVLARQFQSKLIWILVLATVASAFLQEWLNSAAIGVTVLVSAAFGFINEWRSERAIAALAQLTARRAEIVRDGQHEEIPAREVVPGDIVFIDDGDLVPADGRVVESRGLLVNESILTGESVAVTKSIDPDPGEAATAATMVFAGTTVAGGSGTVLITATGPSTELGTIYGSVQTAERKPTPLEQRLEILGNRLIVIFLAVCGLLIVVGLAQGRDAKLVIELAVSLAIGAVPEGLPAVATAALAIAVRQLAKRGVLVRRLDAVETLGSTTFIVTDKTGTLTENRTVVRSVLLRTAEEVAVSVTDAAPGTLRTTFDDQPEAASDILMAMALCGDARVEFNTADGWRSFGDPSEAAALRAAIGLGEPWQYLESGLRRTATEPFSTAKRMMTTTYAGDAGNFTIAKGAFEQIARWAGDEPPALRAKVSALGDLGYRIFAVARETGGERTVLGAVVLEDPIRAEAADAVAASRAAGIRLMLVTGDHIATATTIAHDAGVLQDGQRAILGNTIDHDDLNDLAVVARATHQQKEAIVTRLQESGEVVAMTGDGVNDAAALRASHVGVAVGPAATDVAVEAADIFLSRGDLGSLVDGIAEGRQVARSLREAIIYLLTASFGTIILIGGGLLISSTPPLGPLQILWLNIVIHIFPALALAVSREDLPPSEKPTGALFTAGMWAEIAARAAACGVAGLVVLAVANANDLSETHAQTIVYLTIAAALIGQCFLIGIRSPFAQGPRLRRVELWVASGISVALLLAGAYVPGLRDALKLEVPQSSDLALAGAAVFVAWNVAQLLVAVLVRNEDRPQPPAGTQPPTPQRAPISGH